MTENSHNILIPFGRDAQGVMRRPSEVPNGIACGCFCASCGMRLVSKQGQILSWHFAHQGNPCPHASETAVHEMAKQIILQAQAITIPELTAFLPNGDPHRCVQPEQPIQLTNCQPEAPWHGFRPDILSDQLAIEIHVTHATEDNKRTAFAEHGIAAIEITLPQGIENQDDFAEIVLHTASRAWLFHPRQQEINAQIIEEIRQYEAKRQERLSRQRAEDEQRAKEIAERKAANEKLWLEQAEERARHQREAADKLRKEQETERLERIDRAFPYRCFACGKAGPFGFGLPGWHPPFHSCLQHRDQAYQLKIS